MSIAKSWTRAAIQKRFGALRRSSEVGDAFPYRFNARNSYVEIFPDGRVQQIPHYAAERREAFERAKQKETVLVMGWVGEWRTDSFLVDDPEKLQP